MGDDRLNLINCPAYGYELRQMLHIEKNKC